MTRPAEPPYPGDDRPPARPPDNAPQYPGKAPAYPGGDAPAQPGAAPSYPSLPQQPRPTPSPPTTPPRHEPPQPQQPAPHPHEMAFEQRRVHLTERQRGADATAVGRLALHLPGFFMSLLVMLMVAGILDASTGLPFWILTLLWIASGALVFHRPTEDFFARRLLKLHRPLPQDAARLEPVWREVTARAGVDSRNYELWIESSDDLNAYAAAGHIVAVTRFALERLPSAQLAAVLAHELGHHTGGHAWSSLLGYWYSLPGRVAWRIIRAVMVFSVKVASYFSCLATLVLITVFGVFALATITVLYGLPLILLLIPYVMAAVGRRAELRADRHAAGLGFAPMLAEVLTTMQTLDLQQQHALALATGKPPAKPGLLARLLSTHPDFPTRLQHLQPQR